MDAWCKARERARIATSESRLLSLSRGREDVSTRRVKRESIHVRVCVCVHVHVNARESASTSSVMGSEQRREADGESDEASARPGRPRRFRGRRHCTGRGRGRQQQERQEREEKPPAKRARPLLNVDFVNLQPSELPANYPSAICLAGIIVDARPPRHCLLDDGTAVAHIVIAKEANVRRTNDGEHGDEPVQRARLPRSQRDDSGDDDDARCDGAATATSARSSSDIRIGDLACFVGEAHWPAPRHPRRVSLHTTGDECALSPPPPPSAVRLAAFAYAKYRDANFEVLHHLRQHEYYCHHDHDHDGDGDDDEADGDDASERALQNVAAVALDEAEDEGAASHISRSRRRTDRRRPARHRRLQLYIMNLLAARGGALTQTHVEHEACHANFSDQDDDDDDDVDEAADASPARPPACPVEEVRDALGALQANWMVFIDAHGRISVL